MSVLFSSWSDSAVPTQTLVVSCKSHPDRNQEKRYYECTACAWITLALESGLQIVGYPSIPMVMVKTEKPKKEKATDCPRGHGLTVKDGWCVDCVI